MPEPFKNLLGPAAVQAAARHLARAWPAFDAEGFERRALQGLEALEMKARMLQICEALEATLPSDFHAAAEVIEAALAPPLPPEQAGSASGSPDGLSGWALWAVGEFVARRGLSEPARALATLEQITQRFTAEFAVRPFIQAHPELAFEALGRWSRHDNAHLRRLASEGSRPRLPWGMRLQALVRDPAPALPLLETLLDDPHPNVRKSVANHLNDIAKDHPARVVAWVERHLPGASPDRRRLLRHASRTLLKQGHPGAMAAWGLGRPFEGRLRVQIAPRRVAIGETLAITVTLRSDSAAPQPLVLDYAVHHARPSGVASVKVFKGWNLTLEPDERRVLVRRHSLRPVTTRSYHPGRHAVAIQVNGANVSETSFEVVDPEL